MIAVDNTEEMHYYPDFMPQSVVIDEYASFWGDLRKSGFHYPDAPVGNIVIGDEHGRSEGTLDHFLAQDRRTLLAHRTSLVILSGEGVIPDNAWGLVPRECVMAGSRWVNVYYLDAKQLRITDEWAATDANYCIRPSTVNDKIDGFPHTLVVAKTEPRR